MEIIPLSVRSQPEKYSLARVWGKLEEPLTFDAIIDRLNYPFHGNQAGLLMDIHKGPFDRMPGIL